MKEIVRVILFLITFCQMRTLEQCNYIGLSDIPIEKLFILGANFAELTNIKKKLFEKMLSTLGQNITNLIKQIST